MATGGESIYVTATVTNTAAKVVTNASTTIWQGWTTCNETSATAYQGANEVWKIWASNGTVVLDASSWQVAEDPILAARPWTDEELQERARQAEAERLRVEACVEVSRRRKEEEEQRRLAAIKKSFALLDMFLSPEQRKSMAEMAAFYVQTEEHRYRLHREADNSIVEVDQDNRPFRGFCIHSAYENRVPLGDELLAFKLMLETDEAQFLKTANAFPLH